MKTLPNASMWQKSLIQQVMEHNAKIEKFKNALNNLMEAYTINGNVFGCPNDTPAEINSGYFVIESSHDTLQEAIREMNNLSVNNAGIRIVENKLFQVGTFTNNFSNCDASKTIIDIENQFSVKC